MTRDELEFSISQYLDGTLPPDQRDALDERLATDVEARAIHAEYQSLQGVLTTSVPPVPKVDWDQFAARVSAAVDREEMPAQSYKIGSHKISRWFARPMQFAVTASVLIAGAIAFTLTRPSATTSTNPVGVSMPDPIRIAVIDTPAADAAPTNSAAAASTPPAIVVAIVPPAADEDRPTVLRYADSVVQRPSRAMIVSAAPVAQDTPAAPF